MRQFNSMKDIRKQPTDILVGDYVIIIHEEERLKEFTGSSFLIGEIAKKSDDRNYKMTYYNSNPVNLEDKQYWTKREFIEVVHRYEGSNIIYYKVNDWQDDAEEENTIFHKIKFFFQSIYEFLE
jgi:hypothetical protein